MMESKEEVKPEPIKVEVPEVEEVEEKKPAKKKISFKRK
jgi:hypothetical protein